MRDELIVGESPVVNELLERGARFLHGNEIDHGQIARPDFQREPLAGRHALQQRDVDREVCCLTHRSDGTIRATRRDRPFQRCQFHLPIVELQIESAASTDVIEPMTTDARGQLKSRGDN